ncbi:MAG: hypothetical protein JST00_40985 [Deltaproteobacteria bacterium]|nr:hypothetical protein [Deltaproteobacteria bacterium]
MALTSPSLLSFGARVGARRWNLVGFFALAFFVACDQKSSSSDKGDKAEKSEKGDKDKGDKDDDGKDDEEPSKGVPSGTKGAKGKKKKGGKGGGGTDLSALAGKDFVADLGFRPDVDGFGFENFVLSDPSEIPLGPKDLAKMCGNKAVCAGGGDADECTLRAGAQAFLDSAGKMLSGGHCEGFSVGSLRLFTQDDDLSKLGGDKTFTLERKKKTERYLAYWAVSQASPSVAKATIRTTPNKTLDKLISALKAKSDPYVLGIYKSDGTGGHAIVPYAIEDKGDDKYWVYVYENNSPGTLRHLEFDKGANTWRYDDAQINPSEAASTYEGDSGNPRLELIPQSSRKSMACPFAAGGGGGGSKPAPTPEEDEADDKVAEGDDDVMIVGRGGSKMTVQDDDGHTLGLKDGKLVSEIPGGTYVIVRGKLSSNAPPILIVPAKVKFKLSVRGAAGATDDVAIIGHRFAATLTGVQLGAANKDQIEVDGKAKKLVVLGGPSVASNVTLYMDKGVTVQKLELPKATVGVAAKLQLDFLKGGVTQLDDKGASKPVLVTATPVTTKVKPKIGGVEGVEAIGAPPGGPKPKIGGADGTPPGTPAPVGTPLGGPKPKIGGNDTPPPPPPPTPGKPTVGGGDGVKKPTIGGGGTPTPAPLPAPPPPQTPPGKKPKIGGG